MLVVAGSQDVIVDNGEEMREEVVKEVDEEE